MISQSARAAGFAHEDDGDKLETRASLYEICCQYPFTLWTTGS
jgi:hypothetical protein